MWRQTAESFIRCLENAFRHFGGVTATVVIDNLKAGVIRADWFDPELNPKLEDFARHYGTAILPTKPVMPRHKGKVEAGVKYAQNNAVKGRRFESLAAQNLFLAEWERTVADTRSRLNDVSQAADFRTLTQDNFAILAELVAKRLATYQNGTPTAVIGPPTSGAHVMDEFWRDALGAEWICTSAGTPGTWKQERLAAVTADPGTGTIPTGYLIRNLTSGLVKRHAGSYVWDVVGAVSAPAHSTLTYAASVAVDLAGDPYHTLTLTGNVTLISSNRSAGRSVAVRIVGDGSSRTLTLSEAWKWIGAAKPTALAANKVAVLSLSAFGPSESDVIAAYAVEP